MQWFLILVLLVLGYACLEALGMAVLQVAWMLLVRAGYGALWLIRFTWLWRKVGWEEAIKSSRDNEVKPPEDPAAPGEQTDSISVSGLPIRTVSDGLGMILVIVLILGLIGLGFYGVFAFYRAKVERIRQTRIQLSQLAIRYAHQLENQEKPPIGELQEIDLWGEPIRSSVHESDAFVTVTVTSKGPDRVSGTKDDVAESQIVQRSIKEIAKRAADAGAEKLLEKAKKLFRKNDAD